MCTYGVLLQLSALASVHGKELGWSAQWHPVRATYATLAALPCSFLAASPLPWSRAVYCPPAAFSSMSGSNPRLPRCQPHHRLRPISQSARPHPLLRENQASRHSLASALLLSRLYRAACQALPHSVGSPSCRLPHHPPIARRTLPLRRLGHDSPPMLFLKLHMFHTMVPQNNLLEVPGKRDYPHVQRSSTARSFSHIVSLCTDASGRAFVSLSPRFPPRPSPSLWSREQSGAEEGGFVAPKRQQ